MPYLTFDFLNQQREMIKKAYDSRNLSESVSTQSSIFISHRHRDKEIVKKVVGFLSSFDVNIYVDFLDHELPDKTSSETAKKLRTSIKSCDKFILLATPNSSESKWIPWELGLGDAYKGIHHVAILPLTNLKDAWLEREYFNLYGTIKTSTTGNWCYFPPGENGTRLEKWFNNGTQLLKG